MTDEEVARIPEIDPRPVQVMKAGWQTIDTAPKDATEILLYREDCGVMLGRWIACCDFLIDGDPSNDFCPAGDDEAWEEPDWFGADFTTGYRITNDGAPTHWMPLPTAPALATQVAIGEDHWKTSSQAWEKSYKEMHRRAQKAEGALSALADAERERDEALSKYRNELAARLISEMEAEAKLAEAVKVMEPFAAVEPMDVYEDEDEDARGSYLLTQDQFRAAARFIASMKGSDA